MTQAARVYPRGLFFLFVQRARDFAAESPKK